MNFKCQDFAPCGVDTVSSLKKTFNTEYENISQTCERKTVELNEIEIPKILEN